MEGLHKKETPNKNKSHSAHIDCFRTISFPSDFSVGNRNFSAQMSSPAQPAIALRTFTLRSTIGVADIVIVSGLAAVDSIGLLQVDQMGSGLILDRSLSSSLCFGETTYDGRISNLVLQTMTSRLLSCLYVNQRCDVLLIGCSANGYSTRGIMS
jgi:hypothetical protein